jgi:hypothetical protein
VFAPFNSFKVIILIAFTIAQVASSLGRADWYSGVESVIDIGILLHRASRPSASIRREREVYCNNAVQPGHIAGIRSKPAWASMDKAFLLCLAAIPSVLSFPAEPTTPPVPALTQQPESTPTPTLAIHANYHERRDIFDDLTSYVDGIFSSLGSGIPSYITDGLLPNLQGLPTGSQVLSSASISSSDLDAIPTSVLNIPGYGNYTQNGWNLRFRGNVYKQPNISEEKIDDLTNFFLIDTSVEQLPAAEANQARNLTREIFVVQQEDQNVTMNLVEQSGGISQTITLPYPTTDEGDFDVFVGINSDGLQPGTGDIPPQPINVYAEGTDTGNATSYLVSDTGLTFISDIDDILRVTKIYEPKQGLLNTFARPFRPWMNMPSVYQNWSTSLPNAHFHYLTTTPEQGTRPYESFIYSTYPAGSFDTRPLNFSDVKATLSIRKYLLDRIFQTFPNRKFVLVADTSNSDVMRDYPKM